MYLIVWTDAFGVMTTCFRTEDEATAREVFRAYYSNSRYRLLHVLAASV